MRSDHSWMQHKIEFPMTRYVLSILLACAICPRLIRGDDAVLRWNNGDALSGTFVKADDRTLTWRSLMFTDPLQIEMSHLATVQFPENETTDSGTADDTFRIQVRNGDFLEGRLKSITESTMSFESDRFGAFEIPRNQIYGLHRSANSGLIYSGPRGLEGWQSAFRRTPQNNNDGGMGGRFFAVPAVQAEENTEPEKADSAVWTEEPDGSLATKKADAAIFLPLPFPDRFEIEFELSSTKVCSFLMAIGRDPKQSRRIETWIDVLVAANGTDFVTLQTIGEKDLSVHLHVFIDRPTKTMHVYAATGTKLGEITTSGLRGGPEGLLFRNGEFDMSLRRLRVSHWDGKPPRIVSGDNSRIELSDGTMHFGQVTAFDAATGIVTLTVDSETIETPIAKLGSLILSSETSSKSSESVSERGAAWFRWSDGSYVSGSLVSVNDGIAELKTDYALETLKCSTKGLVQLGLSRSGASIPTAGDDANEGEKSDRLFHEKGTLQGSLVVDGAADAPIQWKPLGGVNASTLQGVGNARFVRASGIRHFSEDPELLAAFPDVVYLKNNDVLPCRVESCSPDEIRLTSPLTEARSFTREHVRAVELSAAGRIHQSGFGAEGWKGLNSKQKTDPGKLEFRGNVEYSHPEILTGDTVRFRLEWPTQSWASLTVSMFGTGRRSDPDSTHVCLSLQPNQIQALDRPMNQNQMAMGGRMGGNNQEGIVQVKDCKADIQLVACDGGITVSVDGKPVKIVKMNPSSSGRRGISFNANVTMVGQVIVNGRPRQRSGDTITLTDFEVDNLSGASIRQFIEEESRQAALTIPRFRRDNPPTHVLIAPNGDLLRGHMQSIDDSHVVFESRLETLRLDRSRVGAVVWLDAPAKTDEKKSDTPDAVSSPDVPDTLSADNAEGFVTDAPEVIEAMLQAQLADGFCITMKPLKLVDGRIEGTSALLGKCSFPARSVRELFTGDPKASQRLAAYDTWVTKMAREPDWDIPQSDGGNSAASELIGKIAPNFELPMLDGTTFKLSDHQDKIVVLDFWATWCGPCVMALPDYIAATSTFDESKVIFVAVNLQETSDQIRTFLTEKQLSPRVALDRGAEVSPKFQVSGIPHTVIIGPGNVVEEVHVAYQPGSGETMQITIQQMLDGTWKRPTTETE